MSAIKSIAVTRRITLTIQPPIFDVYLDRWYLQERALRFIAREGRKSSAELHRDLWTDKEWFPDRSQALYAMLRARLLRISLWDAKLVITRKGRRLLKAKDSKAGAVLNPISSKDG